MQLNHINLPVPNVKETAAFFEKFFRFTCIDIKGDGIIAILKGEDDFLLVLSKLDAQSPQAYMRDFHIGFMVKQQHEVVDIYNNLKDSGANVDREPAKIRSSFGFYFYAPGNIMVEVASPL